jgi:hypothetical protein
MTWPRDQQPVVPYLRIDHVLLSAAVALDNYQVSGEKGSDHDSLYVTIPLRGRGSARRLSRPVRGREVVTNRSKKEQ